MTKIIGSIIDVEMFACADCGVRIFPRAALLLHQKKHKLAPVEEEKKRAEEEQKKSPWARKPRKKSKAGRPYAGGRKREREKPVGIPLIRANRP